MYLHDIVLGDQGVKTVGGSGGQTQSRDGKKRVYLLDEKEQRNTSEKYVTEASPSEEEKNELAP